MKNIFIKIFASVFVAFSLYIGYLGIRNYCDQFGQRDWEKADATVTQIVPIYGEDGGNSKQRYDIHYVFDVGMDTYTGVLNNEKIYRNTGDVIVIKYDPDDPNKTTDILEPRVDALIINVFTAVFMSNFCLWMAGAPNLISLISKLLGKGAQKNESEDEKNIRLAKELCRYVNDGYPVKLTVRAIVEGTLEGHWVALAVALSFIAFGAFYIELFIIPGAAALLIYLYKGVIGPIITVKRCFENLGAVEFYKTVESAFLSKRRPYESESTRIIAALCKKANLV